MATLKDVAARAGVSLSTASIIANGRGDERKISPATQERVREAMRALGYAPNAAARRLRSGDRRKTIALFWADDYREAMLARFLRGLHTAINRLDDAFDIEVHMYRPGSLAQVAALAGVPSFDALLVANAAPDDLLYLTDHRPLVPTVLYNRELDGYASVAVDDVEVGRAAARLIIERAEAVDRGVASAAVSDAMAGQAARTDSAASRVLCVSVPALFEGMRVRERALRATLAEAGLQVELREARENSAAAGYELALEFLARRNARFVFAPSDALALGMLRACAEQGVRVPGDFGIVAVGNGLTDYAAFSCPPLTCVEIPMEEMAASCFDLLAAALGVPTAPEEEASSGSTGERGVGASPRRLRLPVPVSVRSSL